MAIKIIKKGPDNWEFKRCTCRHCGSVLEYTPKDVTYKSYKDYGGGSDNYAEFNCPNCEEFLQICQ